MANKKNTVKILFAIIGVLLAFIFLDKIIYGADVINERYGINLVVVSWLFGICEVFFVLGIVLILYGSGVFNIRWHDIRHFKMNSIRLHGKLVLVGFLLNRISAIVPWAYILKEGWNRLPLFVSVAIILEIIIVVAIGFKVHIPRSARIA